MGQRFGTVRDVAAMEKSIWDIFNHRNGDHNNCPDWYPAHKGDMEAANKSKLFPLYMGEMKTSF